MMDRLNLILRSNEEYTKEEVNNFVFKGIKPKRKKLDEQKEEDKEKKDKDLNDNNAFITSLPQ